MAEREQKGGGKLLAVVVAAVLVFFGSLLGECGLGTGLGPGLRGLVPGAASAPSASTESAPSAPPSASVAPTASAAAAPPGPCVLRLAGDGLTLDGTAVTFDAAVEACKPAGKAELLTTGDANYGEQQKLRTKLNDAGIFVLERQP